MIEAWLLMDSVFDDDNDCCYWESVTWMNVCFSLLEYFFRPPFGDNCWSIGRELCRLIRFWSERRKGGVIFVMWKILQMMSDLTAKINLPLLLFRSTMMSKKDSSDWGWPHKQKQRRRFLTIELTCFEGKFWFLKQKHDTRKLWIKGEYQLLRDSSPVCTSLTSFISLTFDFADFYKTKETHVKIHDWIHD